MSALALAQLTHKLATRLDMGDGTGLIETLKATAFKGQVSDAQMTALMVVANQYGLNPWTKEIYAFPDKQNGIVPVVGVDGWARIINNHPQFDGMEFEQDDDSCTCIMYRKDRSRPVKVTEYMAECRRSNMGPWASHPRRMLRHKAMIQCARLAFGFGGIHDPEEAQDFAGTVVDNATGEILQRATGPRPGPEAYPADKFETNLPKWRELVQTGQKTTAQIIGMVQSRAALSAEQLREIQNLDVVDVPQADNGMGEHADFLAQMNDGE
jgi:phage recombination protein Bet